MFLRQLSAVGMLEERSNLNGTATTWVDVSRTHHDRQNNQSATMFVFVSSTHTTNTESRDESTLFMKLSSGFKWQRESDAFIDVFPYICNWKISPMPIEWGEACRNFSFFSILAQRQILRYIIDPDRREATEHRTLNRCNDEQRVFFISTDCYRIEWSSIALISTSLSPIVFIVRQSSNIHFEPNGGWPWKSKAVSVDFYTTTTLIEGERKGRWCAWLLDLWPFRTLAMKNFYHATQTECLSEINISQLAGNDVRLMA